MISGPEYEAAIQAYDLDYFGVLMTRSLIGGSASDFVLDIDLTTLEATAQPFSYQVLIEDPVPFPQVGTVSRDLRTTATAGFSFLPEFPGFPFFCSTCVLVPGAPYDPATGEINAVGSDHIVAADVDLLSFSRAGDLRLSERVPSIPGAPLHALLGLAAILMSLAFLVMRNARRIIGS